MMLKIKHPLKVSKLFIDENMELVPLRSLHDVGVFFILPVLLVWDKNLFYGFRLKLLNFYNIFNLWFDYNSSDVILLLLPKFRKLNVKCRTVVEIISLFRAANLLTLCLLASGISGINKKQNSNFDVNTLLESGKRELFGFLTWLLFLLFL